MTYRIPALALVLALGSCVAPEAWNAGTYETWGTAGARTGGPYEHPLYSRDGGVVDTPDPGSVVETERPTHDVASAGTGRMYILELYQSAIDERDALSLEVAALTSALEKARADIAALQKGVAESRRANEALEAERVRLASVNEDLAARLVTAQVRRLEAEKLLLESKLEWYSAGMKTGRKSPAKPKAASMSEEGAP